MKNQPFSYDDASKQAYHMLLVSAQKGRASLPTYSGDVALALRLSHREVKQAIETRYALLRSTYGRRVHRIYHKKSHTLRPMNGYILPLQAVLQLIATNGSMHPCLHLPEVLFVSYSGAGIFADSLN
jgi:hypothetical protein